MSTECQFRTYLNDEDEAEHFPMGPKCGKPAVGFHCEDQSRRCAEHSCRCIKSEHGIRQAQEILKLEVLSELHHQLAEARRVARVLCAYTVNREMRREAEHIVATWEDE